MKFSDFAMIMAMYPTTPTEEIAKMFGVSPRVIHTMANSCHVYKDGRKRKRRIKEIGTILIYNARTAEVHIGFSSNFVVMRSKKPVKLQVKWEEM